MTNAGILGIGYAVPDGVLTNHDLERMVDTSDEWITTRTGIKERRIANGETTSDLAVLAAKKAIAHARIAPQDSDMVIVATITPDMAFPATACLVQDRLGCTRAGAFDLSAGCSGFVYALDVATHMVRSGPYRHVLVIGADTLSAITDFSDRSTCVLFGDGAGAAVVGQTEGRGVLATYLGADGGQGMSLYLPRERAEAASHKDGFIQMAGSDVFKFAVRIMGDAALEVLRRAAVAPEDVDLFVPHQANIRIIDAAAKRLGLDGRKIFVNVHKYGNTSAASIPIALAEAYEQGRLNKGDIVTLVGFGAGLTWGAAALEWEVPKA
ncbi:MAG: ketoacyl-ACP synthase III [Firmicutes bacterium]|nr:ketoacyl-ACP synthase III [Bacillota bacterium]